MKRINTNGDFSVWQMGSIHSPIINGFMLADSWRGHNGSNAVLTVEKSTDAPTFAESARAITQSMKLTVNTADGTPSAGKNVVFVYRGDGYEFRKLWQRALILKAWVKSSVTGTFFGGISSGQANNQTGLSHPCSYTIASPNEWTPITLSIAASPESGWWLDQHVGYSMYFFMSLGSSFYGTANAWNTNNAGGTSAQTDLVATGGATFQLADVRIGPATESDFDPCNYDDEVEQAQRYLQKSFRLAQKPQTALGTQTGEMYFTSTRLGSSLAIAQTQRLMPMRKVPAMYGYNVTNNNSQLRDVFTSADCSGTTFDNVTEDGFRVYASGPVGMAIGDTMAIHWLADATLPAAGSGLNE